MSYTMALAKRDFQMGYLSKYSLERNPLGSGWRVQLALDSGRFSPLVDARGHEQRVFKTLDAAVSAIEEVGFRVDLLS